MDETVGVFTTHKLQALLDCGVAENITSRRDLVDALRHQDQPISIHGVEAWFRHVDSNYNLPRKSLCDAHRSYRIPKRRWPALLDAFGLGLADLEQSDDDFRMWCFGLRKAGSKVAAEAPELVGREADMSDLVAFCRRCHEEQLAMALAVVEGVAGIGKSALLSAVSSVLEREGVLVLRCACVERADTALQPILDMVDGHQHAMGRVHPSAAAEIGRLLRVEEAAVGLRNGLLTLLRREFLELARCHDVALVVDDAHWADESSIRLLVQLSRSRTAGSGRIFVVMAVRPDIESPWSNVLRSAVGNALQLHLGPLDQVASATLVETVLDAACNDTFVQWLWDRTMGNPLYLKRMLDHLSRSGELDPTRTPRSDMNVPQSIATAINAQVGRLSESAQRLLGLASVYGAAFEVADLQYAQEQTTTRQVVDDLEEAERIGLIIYDRDRFRFAHPLIRQTLYERLADSRRVYMHFTISQRLIGHETSRLRTLEVANHMLRGRLFADEDALANTCVEASRVAFQIAAWDQVVRFAQAALDIDRRHSLSEPVRREMEKHAGSGLHQHGKPDEAVRHLRRAADAYAQAGDVVEAARATNQICRIRTNYGMAAAQSAQDVQFLRQALPVIRNADPPLAGWILDTLATQNRLAGNSAAAERDVDEALALLEATEPCEELALVLLSAGLLSLDRAQPIPACQYFVRAEATARSFADRGSLARSRQRLALAQYALGRFDELVATADLLRTSDVDPVRTGEDTLVQAVELAMYVLQDRTEDAARTYADARQTRDETGYMSAAARLHCAYAASLVWAGDHQAAHEVIADSTRWRLDRYASATARRQNLALREQLTLLVDELEQPKPGRPIPEHLLIREPRSRRYMADLPAVALGSELAIRRGHTAQIRLTMDLLAEALRRGTAVTAGWPVVCAIQIARSAFAVGDRNTARSYLPLAHDLLRRTRATRLIDHTVSLANELSMSLPG